MNGYVNLLKPPGMSSAAAVAFVKRLTGEKCGHSGTLDPEVAGVLPVMVGRATRLQQYFTDRSKSYVGEISFTGATDTQDAQGTVILPGRGAPPPDALAAVIQERFLGDILQTPPMYSAVKRGGRPLYALARAGQTVTVQPRPTWIGRCDILSRAGDDGYRLQVTCGSGTYIRTLFHDIGQALDRPAHMRMLIRTRSGRFSLRDSVTCERLRAAADRGGLAEYLLPPDWPLEGMPRWALSDGERFHARNGVPVAVKPSVPEGDCAVYAGEDFFGIGEIRAGWLKMKFLAEVAE